MAISLISYITTRQNPGTNLWYYPLSYSSNGLLKVELTGITTEDKYVLRVKNLAGDVLADLRQSPNSNDRAIFDLKNVAQSMLQLKTVGTSGFTNLYDATGAGMQNTMVIEYGAEANGFVLIAGTTYSDISMSNVRDFQDYAIGQTVLSNTLLGGAVAGTVNASTSIINLTETAGCISISEPGVLNNWPNLINAQTSSEYAAPSVITEAYLVKIPIQDVTDKSRATLHFSYAGQYPFYDDVNPNNWTWKNLAGLRYICYDENDLVIADNIRTITLTPENAPVHCPTGPRGLIGAVSSTVIQNTAYYYVYPVVTHGAGCISTHAGYSDTPVGRPILYVYEYQKCNDFEPTLVRWLGEAGTYDSFIFTKRWDYTANFKKSTYYANGLDYQTGNARTFGSEMVHEQTGEYSMVLTTDWLTEEEHRYLLAALKSPWIGVSSILSPSIDNPSPIQIGSLASFGSYGHITNSSWKYKDNRRDGLYQLEITYKPSVKMNLASSAY